MNDIKLFTHFVQCTDLICLKLDDQQTQIPGNKLLFKMVFEFLLPALAMLQKIISFDNEQKRKKYLKKYVHKN